MPRRGCVKFISPSYLLSYPSISIFHTTSERKRSSTSKPQNQPQIFSHTIKPTPIKLTMYYLKGNSPSYPRSILPPNLNLLNSHPHHLPPGSGHSSRKPHPSRECRHRLGTALWRACRIESLRQQLPLSMHWLWGVIARQFISRMRLELLLCIRLDLAQWWQQDGGWGCIV